jgi:RNA polymerase sigma factor for flagellar operon FliA
MDVINLGQNQRVKKLSEDELKALWVEYLEDKEGKKHLRDTLIIQYLQLVKYVVGRIRVNLPSSISTDDLAGYGVEGLIDAINKYRLDKGAKFETYALTRIRGAIIDKVRSQDWVPRVVKQRLKVVQNATQELLDILGRKPSVEEIASHLDTTVEKVEEILADAHKTSVLSLYEKKDLSNSDSTELIDTIQDSKAATPLEQLEEKDSKKELERALARLPERERVILALYYHENLTMKEIGEAIDVSESRVCQLHSQAIMKLRNLLAHNTPALNRSII